MKLWRLTVREIRHRLLNFIMGTAAVVIAVFGWAAVQTLLRSFDHETERMVEQRQEENRQQMAKLEDEIRRSMKGLGFNIYIFPESQSLEEVYALGYATETMPESYVERLANSPIVTINHLLPSLTQRVMWPEFERQITLIGIRGEVPIAHRDPKAPLIDPIEPGELVVGHELGQSLQLSSGQTVALMGRTFTVAKIHDPRGNADDITLWLNLRDAQSLLKLEGRINAIQALECNCATVDRLGEIRQELSGILPGTRIVETASKALARAEARLSAKRASETSIASLQAQRMELRSERHRLFHILLPMLLVVCFSFLAILMFLNVRDRRAEVGIFRALGISAVRILALIWGRAVLMGVLGAVLGLAAVLLWGSLAGYASNTDAVAATQFLGHGEAIGLLLVMPLLAGLAGWLPALAAVLQDPSEALRQD